MHKRHEIHTSVYHYAHFRFNFKSNFEPQSMILAQAQTKTKLSQKLTQKSKPCRNGMKVNRNTTKQNNNLGNANKIGTMLNRQQIE